MARALSLRLGASAFPALAPALAAFPGPMTLRRARHRGSLMHSEKQIRRASGLVSAAGEAAAGEAAGEAAASPGDRRRRLEAFAADPSVRLLVLEGPAGSGKTFAACRLAAGALNLAGPPPRGGSGRGRGGAPTGVDGFDTVVIVRPTVAVDDESLGHLPGDLNDKMAPWCRPVIEHIQRALLPPSDALLTAADDGGVARRSRAAAAALRVRAACDEGRIEALPLAHIRGRDLQRAFVVADEMQNSTPEQMMALLTRIGDGSRVLVTGDLRQSDVGATNGLADLLSRLEGLEGLEGQEGGSEAGGASSIRRCARVVRLGHGDVLRGGGFVRDVLALYRDAGSGEAEPGVLR